MLDKMVKKTWMGRSQSHEECLSKRKQHMLRPQKKADSGAGSWVSRRVVRDAVGETGRARLPRTLQITPRNLDFYLCAVGNHWRISKSRLPHT